MVTRISKVPSIPDGLESKSRKERRKEARQQKRQKRAPKKLTAAGDRASKGDPSVQDSMSDDSVVDTVSPPAKRKRANLKKRKRKRQRRRKSPEDVPGEECQVSESDEEEARAYIPKLAVEKGSKRREKTNFEEFLEMEMGRGDATADEDLEMERRLAKKLKVKGRKLRSEDDGLSELLEEIPSVLEDESGAMQESAEHVVPSKKRRKKKSPKQSEEQTEVSKLADGSDDEHHVEPPAPEETIKYTAPHLRARAGGESEEVVQARRRLRGLLNRLSESNVEPIAEEVAAIIRSISRSVGSQVVGEEVIAACSRGPRGNEQYAAVFAAFVAGMACLIGVDFSAKLIASVAKSYETEFLKEDGISLRNLTLLLSYLCIFGVCSSDLIYDFLSVLSKRLTEIDVSTILTILQSCGMKLRGDDPASMKDFVYNIQNRVNELKSLSTSDTEHTKSKINSKRMEFMLETICDIKNNKKRSKEDPVYYTRLKKWLQKLRVEDVLLRGLTWSKLLDPQKKGQWWLSGEVASTTGNIEEVKTSINKETSEAQKLLQLATSQRMNTDIRRALFCIIMSGEDYIDAFEKILRLDLSGKQDREITRVLVECCLQEKVFNKYYSVLASKLCSYDKNHKFSLQYCIWDHYKELESMELTRSMNLARFVSEMLSSFTLSLSLLKTVDLADPSQMTPKKIMHFRMLFDTVFENRDAVVWNIFTRVAANHELEMLSSSIKFFIKQYVVSANYGKSMAEKFKIAEKALRNADGVLM